MLTVICVYYFFNSIIAGFDLEYAILEGIVLSCLISFLFSLKIEINEFDYIQRRVMTCSL